MMSKRKTRLPPGGPTDTVEVEKLLSALAAPKAAAQDAQEAMKKEFGRRLHHILLAKGWSQSEFARRANLQRDSVSTYLRGKTLPSPLSAKAMADVLGISIADLLPEPPEASVSLAMPSLDIQTLPGSPARARIRIDRIVRLTSALEIARIIETDDLANGN